MAFSVKGTLGKKSVSIEWNDGKIVTDDLTQRLLNVHNESSISTLGPPPMSFDGDRLKEELSAFWFIKDFLNDVTSIEGDIPYPEDAPEGAIN